MSATEHFITKLITVATSSKPEGKLHVPSTSTSFCVVLPYVSKCQAMDRSGQMNPSKYRKHQSSEN